jgi:hypothetical protein
MRSARAVILGALLGLSTAAAQQSTDSSPAARQQRGQQQASQQQGARSQGDEVIEDVTIAVAEVPDDYFTSAQSKFSRDKKAAAEDLHKAAAAIELTVDRAPQELQTELRDAARDIHQLARRVENGTVKSAEELKQPLARAAHALARSHHLRAEEAWNRKEEARAGHELKASGQYLEHAARWTGKDAEKAMRATVRGSRELSGELIEGVGFVPKEVGDGLAAVGRDIEKLGDMMRGMGGAGKGSEHPTPHPKE